MTNNQFRGTRIYGIWAAMHARCHNPKCEYFYHYGARGIHVCERWNTFESFLSDMGHPAPGMSLDRIDGTKGYSPDNCRWASMEEQNENVSRNVFVSFNGEEKIIKHWAKDFDLDPKRVSERLRRGWSVEKALTTPTPKSYEEARLDHCTRNNAFWAERGSHYARNSKRKRRGLSPLAPPPRPSVRQATKASPEIRAEVIKHWQQGMTTRQIAELTKVSKSNAAYIIRDFKLAGLKESLALLGAVDGMTSNTLACQRQRGPKPPLLTSHAQACPAQPSQTKPDPAPPDLAMTARRRLTHHTAGGSR